MLPLLYLADYGQMFFYANFGNDELAAGNGDMIAKSYSGISSIVTIIMACMVLYLCSSRLRGITVLIKNNVLLSTLSGYIVMSTLWSQFPKATIMGIANYMVVILFALYMAARWEIQDFRNALYIFGWIMTSISIALALFFPQMGIDHREGVNAWQGAYPHKNIAAITSSYLFAVGLYQSRIGSVGVIMRYLYLLMVVFFIFMTQSRTGWTIVILLVVLKFFIHFLAKFSIREKMAILSISSVSAIVSGAAIYEYGSSLMIAVGKDPTMTGRTVLWAAVFAAIGKHPLLGDGFRAFWRGMQGDSAQVRIASGWGAAHAQSGFLDVWLEIGLIGLLLGLAVLLIYIWRCVVTINRKDYSSGYWGLSVVLVMIVSNLDERSFIFPVCLEWFVFITSYFMLSRSSARQDNGQLG